MPALDYAAYRSDVRLERMDHVARLYAEITAATRQFLAALAESDRHRDWAEEGFGSCAEWLAWRLGIDRNTASEKVRAARALEALPRISEAMQRGELSYSKVRAVTRVATAANEAELLELARAGSAAMLERVVRSWKRVERGDEAAAERRRHATRSFSVFPDGDGMYVVRGRLDPEVGAALMRAVEAANDALYAEERKSAAEDIESSCDEDARAAARRRRADAIGLVAERALATGFGAAGFGEAETPLSGSRAERYQVMLHVDVESLSEDGELGVCELGDGTRVSAETGRRLSCDAAKVEVRTSCCAGERIVQSASARTRTIPPSVRRALIARDRGCRFPGCGSRFTDAHHIVHWADGGDHALGNLVLLCWRHHRRVHEGGWQIFLGVHGTVVFFDAKGRPVTGAPPPGPVPDEPAKALQRRIRRVGRSRTETASALVEGAESRTGTRVAGVETDGSPPDGRALAPRWKRDSLIPWQVHAAAMDALDPA